MKHFRHCLLSLAIAAGFTASSAFAEPVSLSLAPQAASDQIPGELVTHKRAALPGMEISRDSVTFAWPLDSSLPLDSVSEPFVRESREYWVDVDASTLRSGIELLTTSPGAVVRLSPRADGTRVRDLHASDVVLLRDGVALGNERAMRNVADSEELAAAGASFPDGTLAFRLDEALGAAALTLQIPEASNAYVLHVFEPESPVVMRLTTDRDTAVHGQTFKVFAHLENQGRRFAADAISGVISAPDGSMFDLNFVAERGGGYVAEVRHDGLAGSGAGLWEIHAFANGVNNRLGVQRDAKTAIASSLPTARLSGPVTMDNRRSDGLNMDFALEVAVEGRYEVRGVLYGSDAKGDMLPFAIAHSAAWLTPGKRAITMSFDEATLASAEGLSAPFEIRDLRLLNQGSMELLERRSHGVQIDTR